MQKGLILVIFGALFAVQFVSSLPTSTFTKDNKDAAIKSINGNQKSDGTFGSLKNTFFAVSALNGLSSSVNNKDKICSAVNGKGNDAESVYYETVVSQLLKCGTPSATSTSIIESSLKSSKPIDVAYAVASVNALSANNLDGNVRKADIETGVKKLLTSADDEGLIGSVFTTGLALQAFADMFKTSSDKSSITSELENAAGLIESAEGETSLEFGREGQASGLRVTSTYFSGLQRLANAAGKKGLIKPEQVAQLAESFIQHKHATSLEDIFAVVEGLNAAKATTPQPLVVSLVQNSMAASAKGDDGSLKVRVTDVFGQYASKAKVQLVKATNTKDKSQFLNNQDLVAVEGDNTLYSLSNFLSGKSDAQGFYNLEFKATPEDSSLWTEIKNFVQSFKVTSTVTLADVQVVVADSNDEVDIKEGKSYKAEYPKAVSSKITAEQFQHVVVMFKVKSASGKSIQPHQVFAHLGNAVSPAKFDGKQFVASLNLDELSSQLRGTEEKLTITVGDASLSNSLSYTVGSVNVNSTKTKTASRDPFAPKPEIKHIFRADASRPSSATSGLFTIAVLSPLAILFLGLGIVGANLKNFPMGSGFVWAVGFQACLGAILLLFVYYWLALNMMQTLTYLAVLSVPTVFFAQKALNHMAVQNKIKTA